MATHIQLLGAFGKVETTLSTLSNSAYPPPVAARWLAMITYGYGIGQRQSAWDALPITSPAYDPVVQALDEAKVLLKAAGTSAKRLAALDATEGAFDDLNAVLDTTGQ